MKMTNKQTKPKASIQAFPRETATEREGTKRAKSLRGIPLCLPQERAGARQSRPKSPASSSPRGLKPRGSFCENRAVELAALQEEMEPTSHQSLPGPEQAMRRPPAGICGRGVGGGGRASPRCEGKGNVKPRADPGRAGGSSKGPGQGC